MQYELIHNDDGSITENIYHDHNYAPPGAKIDTRISNVDGTRGYYRNDNGLKYDNSSLDTTAMGKVFDRMKVSAKNIYPAHQKYGITPWEFSYMAAPKYDLPMRDGITVPRFLKKVSGPSGITKEYVVKSDTGERTIRTTDKNGDRYYTFNGVDYHSGSDMYDRYESAFKAYGLQKGGEISNNKFDRFINRIIPAKQRRIDDSRKQEQYMHKYFLESMEPLQPEVKPLLEELMNWPASGSYNMLPNKTTKIDNKKLAEYINQLTKK